jgi:hypothetical protein
MNQDGMLSVCAVYSVGLLFTVDSVVFCKQRTNLICIVNPTFNNPVAAC